MDSRTEQAHREIIAIVGRAFENGCSMLSGDAEREIGEVLERLRSAPADDETWATHAVWSGLRPAVRIRLSRAVGHLRATGALQRADIERFGEVSTAQASVDIAEIQRRLPGLMTYDTSEKCYVINEAMRHG